MTFTKQELKAFTKRVKKSKLKRKIRKTALKNAYRFYNTQKLVRRVGYK